MSAKKNLGFSNMVNSIQEDININKNDEKNITEKKNSDIKKQNNTENNKESIITGKLSSRPRKAKAKLRNMTVTLNDVINKHIEKESEESGYKRNTIVVDALNELFDEETMSFKVKIEKKENKNENKQIPLALPEHLFDEIVSISNKTGKTKSEVVSELLIKKLSE